MGNWPFATLADACSEGGTIQTGPFGSQLHKADYRETGVPVIMPTNINGGRVSKAGIAYIDEHDAERLRRHRTQIGDIVFSRRGEVDKCAVITSREEGWLCGTGCLLARPNSRKANPHFLGYSIGTHESKSWLRQHAVGATMPNLNTGILERLPIPWPPKSAQDEVAAILQSLDDKIELNRRMNETLEAQARALFRDWFVDFGPVKAKMAGAASYLAPGLWSLFPDRLDDEGVPEGWRSFRLDEIADHHTQSLHPMDNPDQLFEHFSLPAYDGGKQPNVEPGGGIKSQKTIVPDGSVLLSKLNPEIPRVWWPERNSGHRQIASTEFLALTPKAGFSQALLYSLFCDDAFRLRLQGMVTGTSKSHQRVSPSALKALEAFVGNASVISKFSGICSSLMSKVLANQAENRTLAQIRDLLLPRLMSGEIRLGDSAAVGELV